MSSNTLVEVFGRILFSFTRGVTEHYNPQEPEYTAESFGYSPLESTGQEWYRHAVPDDECIYQEYSDREATTLDFIRSSGINASLIDASSPEENEETQEDQQDEDGAMAWKRLRPSALRTVCKSMYIGALISLLTAIIIGSVYMLNCYLSFQTINNCEFHPKKSIPLKVQWVRSVSAVISTAFLYPSFFVCTLFLLHRHQLRGVKRKMILVICFAWLLDTIYRVVLQALGIFHSKLSTLQKLPLNILFFMSVFCEAYLLTNHFRLLRTSCKQRLALFLQMIVPFGSNLILAYAVVYLIYPLFNKQSKESKLRLVIALFAPLVGVLFKVFSRILVQRQESITHPGLSCVLLAPLYRGSAIMFRVLQADLDSLQSMAVLGLIHGAAEVIERSTMVLIDHICHVICKRTSAPWGSFRTPRRERLMADIAIMNMLYESSAIVSVNGLLYLYRYIYLQDESLLELLQSFAIATSVQLVIEWFFTSVSLAIETHYQNIAVMAVWQRRWKRHILMAVVATMSSALWISANLLDMAHERFEEPSNQPCELPFA